jgi:putative IMPACT (imprinted ancient) family translation regulator
MLEVLSQRDLTDVLVVVTRYFGGIKLGAGGLIRAYGSTVSAVLDAAGMVERRPLHQMVALVDHGSAGRFESQLRATEFPLAEVNYTASGVEAAVHLAPEIIPAFIAWVAEATSGAGEVVDTGTFEIEVPVVD